MRTILLDRTLVSALNGTSPAVRVAHRDRVPRRPWRRQAAWGPVSHDEAVALLAELPITTIVLSRGPDADPGAACLASVARLLGRMALRLPEPVDAARWVVALAVEWCGAELADLDRAVAVACGVAAGHGVFPRRGWPAGSLEVPHLHPRVLGRWASRAFAPCGWCRCGGGLAGAGCATCGEIVARPVAAASPGGRVVPLRRIA